MKDKNDKTRDPRQQVDDPNAGVQEPDMDLDGEETIRPNQMPSDSDRPKGNRQQVR